MASLALSSEQAGLKRDYTNQTNKLTTAPLPSFHSNGSFSRECGCVEVIPAEEEEEAPQSRGWQLSRAREAAFRAVHRGGGVGHVWSEPELYV